MQAVVKIVLIAVIAVTANLIIKQSRPEYAVFVQLAALIAVFASVINAISSITDYVGQIAPSYASQAGYITLLIKALAIAVVSKIGADICRDSGSGALAFAVETAANAAILLVCMPMLRLLAEIINNLLE